MGLEAGLLVDHGVNAGNHPSASETGRAPHASVSRISGPPSKPCIHETHHYAPA